MNILNENYEWIFSGIGVFLLTIVIHFVKKKNSKGNVSKSKSSNKISNVNNNSITINNINKDSKNPITDKNQINKNNCSILFIDDNHNDFKMVSILKKAGWRNTKAIKDLSDLDDNKVKVATIIFVDINGVGTNIFKDQGIGLAAALKEKYPDKAIILYSAEATGDRFNKNLMKVDASIPKNAEPYEFIALIENYCSK